MEQHPVRTRRLELGLRLTDVAGPAQCSVPLLSMIENGFVPKEGRQKLIADVLQTTPEALWPEGAYS